MKSKQNIPDVISDSIEMRKGFGSSAKNSRRFSAPRRTNTQPVTFRREHGSGVASAAVRPFTMPLLPYMYKPKETVVKIDEEGGSNQTTVVVKPIDPDKIKEISEKLVDEKFEGYE
uniref:Uncharacterized protein n=1 Tax=Acrobeloides nanus TaxID=290746 RepID=A0A914EQ90_9BILA